MYGLGQVQTSGPFLFPWRLAKLHMFIYNRNHGCNPRLPMGIGWLPLLKASQMGHSVMVSLWCQLIGSISLSFTVKPTY